MATSTGLPVVGMVGAGQLARMTHQAAVALGQSLRVLAAHESDPAARVAPEVMIGRPDDLTALRRFSAGCDVLTFDHEHVPGDLVRALTADGVRVYPDADALRHAQDKLLMRRTLGGMGVPVPAFREVGEPQDVVGFGAEHGWPCVLKAVRGGYDGRGVWMLHTPHDARRVVTELLAGGTSLLVEQRVALRRELTALVARSPFGQGAAWPVVETVQRDGICVQVLAPAPGLSEEREQDATALALRLAGELGVVGVLAVELFETVAGRLLVNELAMRPHNSGHWTIEGAVTSQFEQHLRAVLDYPLGATAPRAPFSVMANVIGADGTGRMGLDERLHHLMARYPAARVHLYAKTERPGRKIGHVTVTGDSLDPARTAAVRSAAFLATGRWPDTRDGVQGPAAPGGSRATAAPTAHEEPHEDGGRERRETA